MALKRFRNDVPINNEEDLAVPPGFLSRTSFTLRRLDNELEGAEIDGQSSYTLMNDEKDFMVGITRTPFGKTEEDPVDSCSTKRPIRGRSSADDCVEVNPNHGPCFSKIDDAPVFHPTEEEFKDTLKYVAGIRPVAERFGICRIVPPSSWRPPSLLEDKMTWEAESVSRDSTYDYGSNFTMKSFKRYADDFKRQYFSQNSELMKTNNEVGKVLSHDAYLIEKIETEYWRLIDNADQEIKALRSPFPIKTSRVEDSAEYQDYLASGWNLSNIPKLPGSLLPFGCDTNSTTSDPKLSLGMCFTSRFWKNEEHHLYSLSYMHLGEPKVWYCVPGKYCFKFLEVVRMLPQSSKHSTSLHQLAIQISPSVLKSVGIPVYKCVQNSSEFVLVFPGAYRTEISCGFNCSEAACFAPVDWLPHGQNIVEHYSEFAIKTSISHDKLLIEAAKQAVTAEWEYLSRKDVSSATQMWRNLIGKNSILTKLIKSRVRNEGIRRKHIGHCLDSNAFDDDATPMRRECDVCFYDLYLSVVWCSCFPKRYSCLRHSKRLCGCAWMSKRCQFRYTMPELELLVQAMEGNLAAVYKWVKKKSQPSTSSSNENKACQDPQQHSTSGSASESGPSRAPIRDQTENVVIIRSDCED